MDKELLIKLLNLAIDTSKTEEKGNIAGSAIGKYVIVRSRNEGLNCGYLEAADETGCVLTDARRIWYMTAKKGSWYEAVSLHGLGAGSKVSVKTSKKYIIEDYSITQCSIEAQESLEEFKSHES